MRDYSLANCKLASFSRIDGHDQIGLNRNSNNQSHEEPCWTRHRYYRNLREPETGDWLIENGIFRAWKESELNSIIWLHGITGSGKSVLRCGNILEWKRRVKVL